MFSLLFLGLKSLLSSVLHSSDRCYCCRKAGRMDVEVDEGLSKTKACSATVVSHHPAPSGCFRLAWEHSYNSGVGPASPSPACKTHDFAEVETWKGFKKVLQIFCSTFLELLQIVDVDVESMLFSPDCNDFRCSKHLNARSWEAICTSTFIAVMMMISHDDGMVRFCSQSKLSGPFYVSLGW